MNMLDYIFLGMIAIGIIALAVLLFTQLPHRRRAA
jgi:hypothetical protein